jgi:hypothetical protein
LVDFNERGYGTNPRTVFGRASNSRERDAKQEIPHASVYSTLSVKRGAIWDTAP